ncbi:MAG TPA: ClpXP protease specificity-enhancing factor SspB [Aestuariivirgaceae bacterium]|jgi:hypothetical protein|nr:ClpXP protease specificity-enhancing factor SspB [Aestuariivirgaceae bacterium]
MAEDLMRYDLLVQEALRRVVRLALLRVARTGLPGDHHFFIAINNRHDGVKLSDRLRRKYPNEMTIVLQHQFWNLAVHERHFEVDLSFDNIPEKLSISFEAVKGFFDPSVQFGLQFEEIPADQREALLEAAPAPATTSASNAAPAADEGKAERGPEKIVSLDQFRKK